MARLSLPFVATVAATAACGGTAIVDGDGSSGSGGDGAGTTTTSTTSTSGVGGATSVGSTGAGAGATCPAGPPDGYTTCEPNKALCLYDVACQSGTVTLEFGCLDGTWSIGPDSCVEPYDSCPGTEYYCGEDGWWMPFASNPPSPCPTEPPPEGQACFTGGMGGVWEQCGYRCDGAPDGDWTIATCVQGPSGGAWVYDGACL